MKKKFVIFELTKMEVCKPSTSFYRRENDWTEDYITTLQNINGSYDTIEEAEKELETFIDNGNYTILQVYSRNNKLFLS